MANPVSKHYIWSCGDTSGQYSEIWPFLGLFGLYSLENQKYAGTWVFTTNWCQNHEKISKKSNFRLWPLIWPSKNFLAFCQFFWSIHISNIWNISNLTEIEAFLLLKNFWTKLGSRSVWESAWIVGVYAVQNSIGHWINILKNWRCIFLVCLSLQ